MNAYLKISFQKDSRIFLVKLLNNTLGLAMEKAMSGEIPPDPSLLNMTSNAMTNKIDE
jgi:hypothetical protein